VLFLPPTGRHQSPLPKRVRRSNSGEQRKSTSHFSESLRARHTRCLNSDNAFSACFSSSKSFTREREEFLLRSLDCDRDEEGAGDRFGRDGAFWKQ
jgi:hypothetical protein